MSQPHSETPLRAPDVFAADCPVRPVFDAITSHWAALVVALLATRIDDISEKMLSRTLRALPRDSLVSRAAAPPCRSRSPTS